MVFFNSRVRKRNFSVPLPSERTLDIRDSKNENQLETNQDKEGALTGPEDETRNTLYPAPAFTTFRTTLAKRNSTKSSEWIPLLPTESTDQKTGFPSPPAVVGSTTRTTIVVKRNLTTTHVPPTQDPLEITTVKTSTTAKNDLSEASTQKSSTRLDVSSVQSVAESNISVQTTKPEESSVPAFGSRTTTTRITSLETPRTTKVTPAETSTLDHSQQDTSSARSSTTNGPVVFGSRTTSSPSTTTTTTTTSSPSASSTTTTSKDQPDSSSVRAVLKRPPVNLDATTRSRPHTTEPLKDEATASSSTPEVATKASSSTAPTAAASTSTVSSVETTGHVSRARVRLRDSQIGRFQTGNVNTTSPAAGPLPANKTSTRSFARNLEDVNASEDTNDKNLQLRRIVEGVIGVDNETGNDKFPSSAPLIAPIPDNLNSDKRSSLVRSRTTASKFLTSTRRTPDQSSTTTTTTVGPNVVAEEEVYSDQRLAELSHSGPDYASTERDEVPESETIITEIAKDVTEPLLLLDEEEGIVGQQEPNTPVVERPAGLQKELLAAIRRKITQTRSNTTTSATTLPSVASTTSTAEKTYPHTSFENDVSPDTNTISSTQHPSFFKPIPFPTDQNRPGTSKESGEVGTSQQRVQFFVRVPNSKPGSQVKIPDISHIQGKLARLNAAITEGLQEQRKHQHTNVTNDLIIQEEEATPLGRVESQSTTSSPAISTTSEPSAPDEESLLVLTSTSVSSIFSVVTGSSIVKTATTSPPQTTTETTTSTSSTTTTTPRSSESSSTTASSRLAYKDRIYETGTERNVESTSKASSVSEIITIGKSDVRSSESNTEKPVDPIIAQKTYTYLDRLRESRQQLPATAVTVTTVAASTTTTTTAASTSTTAAAKRTTTSRAKVLTTKKQQVCIN